jgi:hypothetical protein
VSRFTSEIGNSTYDFSLLLFDESVPFASILRSSLELMLRIFEPSEDASYGSSPIVEQRVCEYPYRWDASGVFEVYVSPLPLMNVVRFMPGIRHPLPSV